MYLFVFCEICSNVSFLSTSSSEGFLLNNQFLKFMKEVICMDATSTATAESMAISTLQETKLAAPGTNQSGGHVSISTSAKPLLTNTAKASKLDLHNDDDEDGAGRGRKGKNKKAGKAGKNAIAEEESIDSLPKASGKKGGKRGKDKERATNKNNSTLTASSSVEDQYHIAADNAEADMVASLISSL